MNFTESYDDTCSNVGAAARLGDSKRMLSLITDGNPIDVLDNRGWRPIHEAAARNHAACIQTILDHDEDSEELNAVTYENETPLFLAAMKNSKDAVITLLKAGADINLGNNMNQSPLIIAISNNVCDTSLDLINILLNNKADVNAQMWNGWTALHEASHQGSVATITELLKYKADQFMQDDYNIQPLFIAAQYGNLECLRLLLQNGGDPDSHASDDATALYIAAQQGYPDCIELLLSYHADPNKGALAGDGYSTPLHVAAWKSNFRCMKILEPVTKPRLQHITPLHLAIENGKLAAVELLIELGYSPDDGQKLSAEIEDAKSADPDFETDSLLECCFTHEHWDIFDFLLQCGADVNCRLSFCPLLMSFPKVHRMEKLLIHGANVLCGHVSVELRPSLFRTWNSHGVAYKYLLDRGLNILFNCNKRKPDSDCPIYNLCDVENFQECITALKHYTNSFIHCRHLASSLCVDTEKSEGTFSTDSYERVPSLQHYCRLFIRQQIPLKKLIFMDWVHLLPLPETLKEYLLFMDIVFSDS